MSWGSGRGSCVMASGSLLRVSRHTATDKGLFASILRGAPRACKLSSGVKLETS